MNYEQVPDPHHAGQPLSPQGTVAEGARGVGHKHSAEGIRFSLIPATLLSHLLQCLVRSVDESPGPLRENAKSLSYL